MRNYRIIIAILLMAIVVTAMGGCSKDVQLNDSVVEINLASAAEAQGVSSAEVSKMTGELKLAKLMTGRYELIDKSTGQCVYYIDNATMFYQDENPYSSFVFEENGKTLDRKYLKNLEVAKLLACQYIDSSDVIKEAEKESLKETIQGVTVHYGKIASQGEQQYTATIMRTHGTHIYLTEGYEKYFLVSTFLHELVHVISNETNKGSKYEMSFYRFSAINEGMTELITRQILIETGREKDILQDVEYKKYFPYVYTLIKKVDLITAYFYSGNFDVIFKAMKKDWVDVYYMLVDWGTEIDLNRGIPYWAFAQF